MIEQGVFRKEAVRAKHQKDAIPDKKGAAGVAVVAGVK